ncbi:MAG: hypothetical protein Q8M35_00090 [Pseudohongiella sp.]|nr:hypothetical protein [Pseudohongiella sp.]
MGFFKRKVNPIFVEDEQYQWGGKRRGLRVVLIVLFCAIVIALIVFFATQTV